MLGIAERKAFSEESCRAKTAPSPSQGGGEGSAGRDSSEARTAECDPHIDHPLWASEMGDCDSVCLHSYLQF